MTTFQELIENLLSKTDKRESVNHTKEQMIKNLRRIIELGEISIKGYKMEIENTTDIDTLEELKEDLEYIINDNEKVKQTLKNLL